MKKLRFLLVGILILVFVHRDTDHQEIKLESSVNKVIWTEGYRGWGPTLYYQNDVLVAYEGIRAENYYLLPNGDIKVTEAQMGIAKIFPLDGNLVVADCIDRRVYYSSEVLNRGSSREYSLRIVGVFSLHESKNGDSWKVEDNFNQPKPIWPNNIQQAAAGFES